MNASILVIDDSDINMDVMLFALGTRLYGDPRIEWSSWARYRKSRAT
jgi:hypothetical protein